MKKSRAIFIEIAKCLGQLALLPIAPYAEERIQAHRLYRDSLTLSEQMEERQRPDSLLNRLARSAHRQERLNSIALPVYYELQRHAWDRSYAYFRFGRKLLLQLAFIYGLTQVNSLLGVYWPHGQHVFESSIMAACQQFDAFWGCVYRLLAGANAR